MRESKPLLVGFSDNPHERWLSDHLLRAVGVVPERGVALCWGAAPPDGIRAAVVVPRDEAFLQRPEALTSLAPPADAGAGLKVNHHTVPTVRLEFDVANWISWFVSRAEEYEPGHEDPHGRFMRSEGLAERLGLSDQPIADLLALRLRRALELAAKAANVPLRRQPLWPQGKRFAVCMTHDVDRASRRSIGYGLMMTAGGVVDFARGKKVLARRRFDAAAGFLRGGRRCRAWLFEEIAEREAHHGFRSAFYLMALKRATVPEAGTWDHHYRIHNPKVIDVFRGLARDGWELGLHTSYHAHDRPGGLAEEWARLQDVFGSDVSLAGGRSHYLRFRVPETWEASARCGMQYDATLGWPSGWGFRPGTCLPFKPFDRNTDRPIDMWELGMHYMDTHAGTLNGLVQDTRMVLDRVAAVGGCACLLFHPVPPPAENATVGDFLAMYDQVLATIAERRDAWVATPRSVVEHLDRSRERSG